MRLRKLKIEDAPLMLEWMHDPIIQKSFRRNMLSATEETVRNFIHSAQHSYPETSDLHFAIADDKDEYMGTISLKDINSEDSCAEYAIVLRRSAHGKGFGSWATKEILKYAFQDLKLERVYLNVLDENKTAIRMYERNGFVYEGTARHAVRHEGILKDLRWYSILRTVF